MYGLVLMAITGDAGLKFLHDDIFVEMKFRKILSSFCFLIKHQIPSRLVI